MCAAAAYGGTALANHQFSDIGPGNFFHEPVGAIADAGCALGFPDDTFRPNDGATRGQFAFWLNNCGGRVAFDENTLAVDPDNGDWTDGEGDHEDPLTEVTIRTGGATGSNGSGFLVVTHEVRANTYSSSNECPCFFETRVMDQQAGQVDGTAGTVPTATEYLFGTAFDTVSSTTVIPVDADEDRTLELQAQFRDSNEPLRFFGSLTVLYVPFGAQGGAGL